MQEEVDLEVFERLLAKQRRAHNAYLSVLDREKVVEPWNFSRSMSVQRYNEQICDIVREKPGNLSAALFVLLPEFVKINARVAVRCVAALDKEDQMVVKRFLAAQSVEFVRRLCKYINTHISRFIQFTRTVMRSDTLWFLETMRIIHESQRLRSARSAEIETAVKSWRPIYTLVSELRKWRRGGWEMRNIDMSIWDKFYVFNEAKYPLNPSTEPRVSRTFLHYPFLLSLETKKNLLLLHGFATLYARGIWVRSSIPLLNSYAANTRSFSHELATRMRLELTLNVRRPTAELIEDLRLQLPLSHEDLTKQVKVSFRNELGGDHGGVLRELFNIAVRAFLGEERGLFKREHETGFYWFAPLTNPSALDLQDLTIFGAILGLITLNGCSTAVPLPDVVFAAMKGNDRDHMLTNAGLVSDAIADLQQAFPAVSRSLQSLCSLKPEELNALDLDFSISPPHMPHTMITLPPAPFEHLLQAPAGGKQDASKHPVILEEARTFMSPAPATLHTPLLKHTASDRTPSLIQLQDMMDSGTGTMMSMTQDADDSMSSAHERSALDASPVFQPTAAPALADTVPSVDSNAVPILVPGSSGGESDSDLRSGNHLEWMSAQSAQSMEAIKTESMAGGPQAVTVETLPVYILRYAHYLLHSSVKEQLEAISRGFQLVYPLHSPILGLLTPSELSQILAGSKDILPFSLLKPTAYYDGWNPKSETIQWFWEVVESLSLEDQRRLLVFVTGCERLSVDNNINLKIMRDKNHTDRIPCASTCFSQLYLPTYSSRENLEKYLRFAIDNNEGFGIV